MKRKKVIRLTENDLNRIVKRVINEAYEGGIIQKGDDSCEIRCKRKLAKNGSNGDVVKYIQHLLAANGFNPEYEGGGMGLECSDLYQGCDGKYRRHTKDAVKEFQRKYNLTADGIVGYNTLMKMCEVFKPGTGTSEESIDAYDLLCKDCDCKRQRDDREIPTPTDPIFSDDPIGGDPIDRLDCKKLKDCLRKFMNSEPGTQPRIEDFLECIGDLLEEGCEGCPPKAYKTSTGYSKFQWDRDITQSDLRKCIDNGCTKIINFVDDIDV
jgi:hypothetical protein